MSDIEKVRLFDNQKIRTVWVEEDEEWYFSVKDVVTILTETTNAKDYISKMRRRDEELSKGWGQIVHPPYNNPDSWTRRCRESRIVCFPNIRLPL